MQEKSLDFFPLLAVNLFFFFLLSQWRATIKYLTQIYGVIFPWGTIGCFRLNANTGITVFHNVADKYLKKHLVYLFQDISLVYENHYIYLKKQKSFLNAQGGILAPAEAFLFPVQNSRNTFSTHSSHQLQWKSWTLSRIYHLIIIRAVISVLCRPSL